MRHAVFISSAVRPKMPGITVALTRETATSRTTRRATQGAEVKHPIVHGIVTNGDDGEKFDNTPSTMNPASPRGAPSAENRGAFEPQGQP